MYLIFFILSSVVFTALSQIDPYRPQYHVMPPKNWMNDPNGPMYYKGNYHLFYQYNPNAPVWGPMHWGHVYSTDLIHWKHLPIALYPDQPYDNAGVWSGSSAILPDGTPIIVYTGDTNVQDQCVAFPKNTSDPLLQDWSKPSYNPIIPKPPPGVDPTSFRDPVTPWKEGNDWYLVTGCQLNNLGAGLLWSSPDLKSWTFLKTLYSNGNYGSVWECPDFFQIPNNSPLYIFKFSGNGQDFWTVGNYNTQKSFVPLTGAPTVLISVGRFYASKSFFDPVKKRQINWGWVSEEDNNGQERGWQGVQSFPCEITFDNELKYPLSAPIKEISLLRNVHYSYMNVTVSPTSPKSLLGISSNQIEIVATFNFTPNDAPRGFGVRILESPDSSVYTSIIFQQTSSSQATLEINRSKSGSTGNQDTQQGMLPIKSTDSSLTIHILIDHSIVEVFGQGGRTRITSRLYTPPNALGVSLFSNVKTETVSIDAWTLFSCWD